MEQPHSTMYYIVTTVSIIFYEIIHINFVLKVHVMYSFTTYMMTFKDRAQLLTAFFVSISLESKIPISTIIIIILFAGNYNYTYT